MANPVSAKIDQELYQLFKLEAEKRKTTMQKVQKRLARNIKTQVIDLFDEDGFFR